MDELVYRRLCMTSVCGAILIPVTMALVSEHATQRAGPASAVAMVVSTTAADATRPAAVDVRGAEAQTSPFDPTIP